MRRLFATRVDTRMPVSFVAMRLDMNDLFVNPVECIKDFTDDYSIIFLVTCTASGYNVFRNYYKGMSDWIEFDYFNLNKIEE